MTADELRALGPTVSIGVAATALGVGESTAYALARDGRLPVAVLPVGWRRRVITEDLIRVLHLDRPATAA